MGVVKYKDPVTGEWFPAPAIRVLVEGGSSGDWDTTGIPEDIVTEAERVVNSMISKIGSNCLTFIAMSDSHEMGDGDHTDASIVEQNNRSNRNAGQAAKLISQKIPLDFFAHLGDFAWGSTTTTTKDGVTSVRKVREYLADVVLKNESFLTPGNHDCLSYSRTTAGEFLNYDVLTSLTGTYQYKDFDQKKVRVICLNTADNNGSPTARERISGEQLQWFCEALDLSAKSDSNTWGIVILSHHPLDWGNIKPAGNVLAAYLEGGSFTATHEGVSVSYNFAGKNGAKIIAQFHGHVHNFKVDYINDLRTGTPIPTDVKRVAIPNACFTRNNEYGENNKAEHDDGIEFGETVSYDKVDNHTGKNTAFCLVSIDLDEKVIYADCFGAGYDRVVSYGENEVVTYTVTNNLTNARNSNGSAVVTEGASYSAVITAEEGYSLDSVTVTMGGVPVPVENGSISIASVTGNIVITATAVKNTIYAVSYDLAKVTSGNTESTAIPGSAYTTTLTADSGYTVNFVRVFMDGADITAAAYSNGTINIASVTGDIEIIAGYYTNRVPTMTEVGGTAVFNGIGYKNGYYSSGTTLKADAECVATGLLPYDYENGVRVPVYIKGAAIDTSKSHCRILGFKNSGAAAFQLAFGSALTTYFSVEILGTQYYRVTPLDSMAEYDGSETHIVAFNFSLIGTGEKLIITVDEPIE